MDIVHGNSTIVILDALHCARYISCGNSGITSNVTRCTGEQSCINVNMINYLKLVMNH